MRTWMTLASRERFWEARARMASSMVPAVASTSTSTAFFCPMRCARSSACGEWQSRRQQGSLTVGVTTTLHEEVHCCIWA